MHVITPAMKQGICHSNSIFFCLEGFWGQAQGPNFPSPRATMLALNLDCSTAPLATPQKVLSIWELVDLKMLDFSDHTGTWYFHLDISR